MYIFYNIMLYSDFILFIEYIYIVIMICDYVSYLPKTNRIS